MVRLSSPTVTGYMLSRPVWRNTTTQVFLMPIKVTQRRGMILDQSRLPSAALQHQNEIGSIGTPTWQNQDAYQQMTTILGGGIVRVTTDLDIALAMAGGLGAKGVLGLLGELRGTKLAGERAEDILASGAAKATATPRTPLAGPTENWKTFVNAEKQIQLEAGARQRVDQVINETLSGRKDFTSSTTLTTDEALSAGQKYLGPEYREIGKPGSGVFHSADGTKEFRIDSESISGAHAPGVPHVHFGVKDPVTGKYILTIMFPMRTRIWICLSFGRVSLPLANILAGKLLLRTTVMATLAGIIFT